VRFSQGAPLQLKAQIVEKIADFIHIPIIMKELVS
jgi:hypothetical protein